MTGGPWINRAGNGNPAMGTGYVLRSAAELFLIGTLGAPRTKNKGQRNLLLTADWPQQPEDRQHHRRQPAP